MDNLVYHTDELEKYFSRNRIHWGQFYESERVVIEKVWPGDALEILDVGCGCGGLGLALQERFGPNHYTGVEISPGAAKAASHLNPQARILGGDFLQFGPEDLAQESFDLVFSLSCIDWNLNFDAMLDKAWSMVRPSGILIASFRLTTDAGVNDITKSYQYINYEGRLEGEIAPYVVLNAADLIHRIRALRACQLFAYGYYGPPSKTAITPYRALCFAAIAARKPGDALGKHLELQLPKEIASVMRDTWLTP